MDIELMHYLVNPEKSHKIDILSKTYLGIDLGMQDTAKQPTELSLFDEIPEDEDDSKRFEELAKSKLEVTSSDRVYVTFNIKDLRRPKEINNSGIYYETNLSSNSICHFIKTLIECFELEVNEFEFTIE